MHIAPPGKKSPVRLCFQRRTQFTELVKNRFAELGLYILWENENQLETISSVDYTHMQVVNGNASISTIDHFACSYGLINNICEAGVVHRGDNPSNYSAIYAKINVGDYNSTSETIIFPKRINWEASTEQARSAFNTVLTEKT